MDISSFALTTDAIDLSAIPTALAGALGISTFAAEILMSAVVVLIVVVITAIFTKDTIILVIMTLLGITLSIAMGWLDYFFLVFACLIVALMYSSLIREKLSGG